MELRKQGSCEFVPFRDAALGRVELMYTSFMNREHLHLSWWKGQTTMVWTLNKRGNMLQQSFKDWVGMPVEVRVPCLWLLPLQSSGPHRLHLHLATTGGGCGGLLRRHLPSGCGYTGLWDEVIR